MEVTKYILTILSLIPATNLHGQDYRISFAGDGQSSSVTSVKVENLTRGTSITIDGNDILHLLGIVTGVEDAGEISENGVRFSPNPVSERSKMEFYLPEAGKIQIIFFDQGGRIIYRRRDNLDAGEHSYNLEGPGSGMYFVRIIHPGGSVTGSFISMSSLSRSLKAEYIGSDESGKNPMSTKGALVERIMQYNEGDRLKFTGSSGNYSTVITDVPSSDKLISFSFQTCTDGIGNNYSVVNINGQVWMAENLRTTKFNDGAAIPYIASDTAWAALDQTNSFGFCWYENDSARYKNVYGGLYNSWSVNTGKLCPAGWHIPSSDEWYDLCLFLDPESILGVVSLTAGGKLKETGTLHWEDPNAEATNETGFSALPGGHRFIDGSFSGIRKYGYWSADNGLSFHYMEFGSGNVFFSEGRTENGHSVRCIKNN